ncbi:MAG: helix-turn-helix transcriptional regulator [Proteobacteria bacterium]|nr:helix-turn-helix transcriptional regulator [Pseudomonadota bacterium]
MNIRELRKQKYWSQDQLAQMSGLSIRTIQRIERDQKAGLESLKALSAVFDIEISELQREAVDAVGIITAEQDDQTRKEAYTEGVIGIYKLAGLAIFSLIFTFVFVVDDTTGWGFIGLMAVSWTVIIGVYALNTFDLFGDEWKSKIWARKSQR